MWRIPLIILALVCPFFFPWPFTVVVAVLIGICIPIIPFIVGLLLDLLYYGGYGIAYFALIGIPISIVCYFVRDFIKTRII